MIPVIRSHRGGIRSIFPTLAMSTHTRLAITGDSMLPVFRKGYIVVLAPNAAARLGDRVVVKSRGGEDALGLARALVRGKPPCAEPPSVGSPRGVE